jgi:hypothetical protein
LLACQSIESNVHVDHVSFIVRYARRSLSCIWDVSWAFISFVNLLPQIDSDASSVSQWAQVGFAAIGPLACARKISACESASMFSLSSCVNGRSMISVCPFIQWKLNAIPSHHHTIRSWILMMRSQSPFVLWKILLDFGCLAVTTDSLSHMNHTDRTCIVPAQYNVPRTASPATIPPSYDRYEVISDWILSSGPPPQRRSISYLVAMTHTM